MILKIVLVLGFITFVMITVVIGGSKNKSEYEMKIEEEEQRRYLENYKRIYKNRKEYKMERKFIDSNWCVTYVLLAFDSMQNSETKNLTIEEFINKIEGMFNNYTDDIEMRGIKKKLRKRLSKMKITIV